MSQLPSELPRCPFPQFEKFREGWPEFYARLEAEEEYAVLDLPFEVHQCGIHWREVLQKGPRSAMGAKRAVVNWLKIGLRRRRDAFQRRRIECQAQRTEERLKELQELSDGLS